MDDANSITLENWDAVMAHIRRVGVRGVIRLRGDRYLVFIGMLPWQLSEQVLRATEEVGKEIVPALQEKLDNL